MSRARRQSAKVNEALDRLAKREAEFVGSEFLAPVLRGRGVRVRIAGVICRLDVSPRAFEGFGVFRATSHPQAHLVAPAAVPERKRYLELVPRVSLTVSRRDGNSVSAVPAGAADARFEREAREVSIELVDDDALQLFDTAVAHFDGGHYWFGECDGRADPATAAY